MSEIIRDEKSCRFECKKFSGTDVRQKISITVFDFSIFPCMGVYVFSLQKKKGKISVYKHRFCYSNMPTTGTRPFVSRSNEALAGTLLTIGDVNDIFPIREKISI